MRLSPAASGAGERASGRRPALVPVALFATVLAVLAFLFIHPPRVTAGGIDFTAFYCASKAISSSANPYRYEPVHACEHANRQWSSARSIVVAPLPPYALALLSPIARLPYAQASFVWFLLLVAGAGVIVWAIVELTNLPLLLVGIPVVIAVLLQSLPTGALAPIPLALLTAAAVMLARKRWNATALLLGFASVEPHVTLPVLAAVFVLVREMRIRLAIVAAALVGLSLIAGGPALNIEYFAHVLPGHARFELGSIVQFGLSSMLHNFGLSDNVAIAIGSLQYAVFALLGIWLAQSLRPQTVAMVVLVPMALAVVGGVYIHLTQLAAVIPLAFVIASRTQSPLAWTGIVLLAVPWNLLDALTPTTLIVPRVADVLSQGLTHHNSPGELAYVANALVYAGVVCVFAAAVSGCRRLRVAAT
jgi:hypothetical protein